MSNELEFPLERTTIELMNGILIDLQHLIEQKIQLTRREIELEIRLRSSAVVVLLIGVVVLFLDAILLCLMLVHLMHWGSSRSVMESAQLPLWACHGIVAFALCIIGMIFIYVGWSKLNYVAPCRTPAAPIPKEGAPWTPTRI